MNRSDLKKRLRYVELATLNSEAALTAADPNYDDKDGFDKAIEGMETELGYTYPLTLIQQRWALKRAHRHALQLLLNANLQNMDMSISGVGTMHLKQITTNLKTEVGALDSEFGKAVEKGEVPLGEDSSLNSGGFSVTPIAWGSDPDGNLVM